jgi:hypothetical protein
VAVRFAAVLAATAGWRWLAAERAWARTQAPASASVALPGDQRDREGGVAEHHGAPRGLIREGPLPPHGWRRHRPRPAPHDLSHGPGVAAKERGPSSPPARQARRRCRSTNARRSPARPRTWAPIRWRWPTPPRRCSWSRSPG